MRVEYGFLIVGALVLLASGIIYRIDGLKRGGESFLRVVGCFFVLGGLLCAVVLAIVLIVLRRGEIDLAAWE